LRIGSCGDGLSARAGLRDRLSPQQTPDRPAGVDDRKGGQDAYREASKHSYRE
jgi:hypothetical protein